MQLHKQFHWLIFSLFAILLYGYFGFIAKIQLGGDIIDYYGATETILDHAGLDLRPENQQSLSEQLNPGYFESYYNIPGINGKKYPVHFTFYSLLLIPFRLLMTFLHQDELKSFWFLNITILLGAIAVIWRVFKLKPTESLVLLALVMSSPLISFIKWPGPDLYFLSLLLIAVYAFFRKRPFWALVMTALASWHSQPLIIMSGLIGGYYVISESSIEGKGSKKKLVLHLPSLFKAGLVGLIALIPYAYNLLLFGMFTPWYAIPDGWTKWYGFGVQNISLKKLFEQFFDLNMGLFWYMPVSMMLGAGSAIMSSISKKTKIQSISIITFTLLTALFYQTNPGWHYGTVGYGPTRHIAFAIPVILYFCSQALHQKWAQRVVIPLILISQLLILTFNGLLEPDLGKTHFHTPISQYVLNNHPELYNPTPEIFIDRTNHTDFGYPTTAIYKIDGVCKKAYVLIGEEQLLQDACGTVPTQYKNALTDQLKSVANYSRKAVVTSATFWPAGQGCADWFYPTEEKPYVCMDNKENVILQTGINDIKRIDTVPGYQDKGIWRLLEGDPIEITVPPGYFIHHSTFDGIYVTF